MSLTQPNLVKSLQVSQPVSVIYQLSVNLSAFPFPNLFPELMAAQVPSSKVRKVIWDRRCAGTHGRLQSSQASNCYKSNSRNGALWEVGNLNISVAKTLRTSKNHLKLSAVETPDVCYDDPINGPLSREHVWFIWNKGNIITVSK